MVNSYSAEEVDMMRRYDDTAKRMLAQFTAHGVSSLQEFHPVLERMADKEGKLYGEPGYEARQYLRGMVFSLLNGGSLVLTADRRLLLGEPFKKRRFDKAKPVLQSLDEAAAGTPAQPRYRVSGLAV